MGEQKIVEWALTIILFLLMLPFYLGCYIWQQVMRSFMDDFDSMLLAELERCGYDLEEEHNTK